MKHSTGLNRYSNRLMECGGKMVTIEQLFRQAQQAGAAEI